MYFEDIAYNGCTYLALGGEDNYYSTDGVTWQKNPDDRIYGAIGFGKGLVILG